MLSELLVILVLILANGFLAGAEIAVISVRKTRLGTLLEQKRAGARSLATLRAKPERFLATVQIGITVVGTAAGAFGGAAFASDLEPVFRGLPLLGPYAHDIAFGVVVALVSYLSLVLGELVPKSLALRAAEPYALLVAQALSLLAWLMRPLVWLLTASSNLILRPFADSTTFTEGRLSRKELQEIVDEAAKSGAVGEHTGELASRALQFEQLTGSDIMIARNHMVALAKDADDETIRSCLLDKRRSRMPVYEGTLDNIVGYVTAKDLLPLAWGGHHVDLGEVLRPVHIVMESTPAVQILQFMQRERQRVAILIDEHGATAGLVTFEDLVEELVGEVMSEHELGGAPVEHERPGALLARGDVAVRDLAREFKLRIATPRTITTVGGLCSALAGGVVPQRGARLADPSGVVFEVLDASPRLVRRVRVLAPASPGAAATAGAPPTDGRRGS